MNILTPTRPTIVSFIWLGLDKKILVGEACNRATPTNQVALREKKTGTETTYCVSGLHGNAVYGDLSSEH